MAHTPAKDNPRERALRSKLHRAGFRFRIHYTAVPGTKRTIDIAFTRLRLAVFCDGCFWHGCPAHSTIPKANREWWLAKINANKARDRDTDQRLIDEGWIVLRIWEHMPLGDAALMVRNRLKHLMAFERAHEQPATAQSPHPNERARHFRLGDPSC